MERTDRPQCAPSGYDLSVVEMETLGFQRRARYTSNCEYQRRLVPTCARHEPCGPCACGEGHDRNGGGVKELSDYSDRSSGTQLVPEDTVGGLTV